MRWMSLLLLAGCGSAPLPSILEEPGIDGWTARLLIEPGRKSTRVTVTFRNVSNGPKALVPVNRWDEFLPGWISNGGGQAKLEIRQESGRPPGSFGIIIGGSSHHPRQPDPVVLGPGEERSYEWHGKLGPGTYDVQVTYYFAWDEDGICPLRTDPVRFIVPE